MYHVTAGVQFKMPMRCKKLAGAHDGELEAFEAFVPSANAGYANNICCLYDLSFELPHQCMQSALVVQGQLALLLLQFEELLQLLMAWHADVGHLVVKSKMLHCGRDVDLGSL